ncbi:hypothetical protein Daus18300_011457 [Diaporthe australafricana]|uniref:Alpha/beta hydrolase fold-3 domain-containing protein n=1 Tax=Diaporthe australafricana TaxID=127596 RepID=A0ABR3W6Q7_9PEZI
MEPHSFLGYFRLKVIITFLRILTLYKAGKPLRRDAKLAEANYSVRRERLRITSRDARHYIDAELYVLFALRASHELQINILGVDYRKVPEHPFPAAIHDVEATLRWVGAEENRERFDASRVAVSGFSSGGTLALVASSALRADLNAAGVNISAAAAVYPGTDLVSPPEHKKPPKDGINPMNPAILNLFTDCYVLNKSMRADPRASPGRADPQSYPQMVAILTYEGDQLAPEGLALADKLKQDGQRKVIKEMILVPLILAQRREHCKQKRRDEMYALIIKTLKEALL